MKRKLFTVVLAMAMVAILATGASLAYFTDKKAATNTFTAGNVAIDLIENGVNSKGEVVPFSELTSAEKKLLPAVNVHKDVFVKNTGSEDAYVRVHIAIPKAIDDGDPTFNASNNLLHFNFTNASVVPGQWSWTPEYNNNTGYRGNGAGNWNFYTTKINDLDYNVYVVTYRSILAPGVTTTTQALDKVYIDKSVNASIDENGHTIYTDKNGNKADMNVNSQILVIAEATQTAPFGNAYDALNAAFGVPGAYNAFGE